MHQRSLSSQRCLEGEREPLAHMPHGVCSFAPLARASPMQRCLEEERKPSCTRPFFFFSSPAVLTLLHVLQRSLSPQHCFEEEREPQAHMPHSLCSSAHSPHSPALRTRDSPAAHAPQHVLQRAPHEHVQQRSLSPGSACVHPRPGAPLCVRTQRGPVPSRGVPGRDRGSSAMSAQGRKGTN